MEDSPVRVGLIGYLGPGVFCTGVFLGMPVLLAGCGGGGSNGSAPAGTPSLSVSAPAPDGLTATLSEDRATVPVGGSVAYSFTLTNHTSQPITYLPVLFSGVPVSETGNTLQITDASGGTVFTAGASPGTRGDGPSVTVAPGQSVGGSILPIAVFSSPGQYSATATVSLEAAPGAAVQETTLGPLVVTAQ